MKSLIQFLCVVFLGVLLLWCGCGETPLAGSGTEDGNSVVVGKIVKADGTTGSNTRVLLVSEEYNPAGDSASEQLPPYVDTTDTAGAYRFEKVVAGVYNVEAVQLEERTRALVRGIEVKRTDEESGGQGDTVNVSTDTLQVPGAASVVLPGSLLVQGKQVYIKGTTIKATVDSEDVALGYVLLDSLPAGNLPSVYVAGTGEVNAGPIVVPGDTVSTKTGKVYRVSTSGDDANDGINAPLRTITKGCAVVQAGDTLLVHDGMYSEYSVKVLHNGFPGSPIVIMAQNPFGTVLKGNLPDSSGEHTTPFLIDNKSQILISGFEIKNYVIGIKTLGSSFVTVTDCRLFGNSMYALFFYDCKNIRATQCVFPNIDSINSGVVFQMSQNFSVDSCYFSGNRYVACDFQYDNRDGTIQYCTFEGISGTAISLGSWPSASSNLRAQYNIIRPSVNTVSQRGIYIGSTQGAVCRYNYIEQLNAVTHPNMTLAGVVVDSTASSKIEIHQNVFAYCSVKNALHIRPSNASAVQVYHNTFYQCTTAVWIEDTSHVDLKNNLYSASTTQDSSAYRFVGDPSFIGPLTQLPLRDGTSPIDFGTYFQQLRAPFALQAGSPAIDIGVDVELEYKGSAPDMGAMEY